MIEIKMPTELNMCYYCFGYGKVKAMQMAMTYDKGTVRDKDTTTKCSHCDGTGRGNSGQA